MSQNNITQETATVEKDYEYELSEAETAISNALTFLQRARKVLVHLENTYFTNRFPDGDAALSYVNTKDKSEEARAVMYWCYDHNKIDNFMSIIHDYMFDVENILEDADNRLASAMK